MNSELQYPEKYILPEKLQKLYKRHRTGAYVRSVASIAMWLVTLIIFLFGVIKIPHFLGVTVSVLYLILINPPTLFCLKHIRSKSVYEYSSLFINQLEIIGYTSIIYFCGGIEASYYTLLYAGLIVYVGVIAPRKFPFIVASLCIVTYSIMLIITYQGYFPQMKTIHGEMVPLSLYLWIFSIVSGLLYVIAYISATTASLLKKNKDQLNKKNKELIQVNKRLGLEIEEHRLAEEALIKSEKRFREIAGLLPSMVCETDINMNVGYINKIGLDLFGLSDQDLEKGVNLKDVVHPNEKEKISHYLDRIFMGEDPKNTEYRFQIKDGSEIMTLICASPINENGHVVGVRMSITDITERKKLELQLQQAQKMEAIGTLAGGIAHNFNNLLMGIQGYTSLIMMDTPPDDPRYGRLQRIENQVLSGSKLTKQLLGYARKGKYEIKRLDLNLLVREISEIFGMTKKQIRIHLELAEDLFVVNADQGQIEQLLLNIFINAADAMPTGGDLYITAMNTNAKNIKHKSFKVKDSGNFIQIVIRDTGIGMDQKIVDRIFEPFFTTKGLASGTGLGMASVYGIIKGHGGYINVKSKVGRGTTFDIYLPAAGESILKNKESNIEAVKGQGTLLLVDDEDVILEVAQEYLNLLGYNVLLAKGGKAAIDIYQQKKDEIDMVLLDMVMPDLSGGDTYDRVKEINPHVKVLLSSGYSIDGQARDIINRGCNGFIQKPFTLKDLSYKLKEVLGPA